MRNNFFFGTVLLPGLLISSCFLNQAQMRPQLQDPQTQTSPRERPDESKLLTILINEVHQLRLALEQNNLLQHHSSVLLAHVRRQEDVIRETVTELRTLEKALVDLAEPSRYDEQLDDLKDIETRINRTTDPEIRLDLVQDYEGMKRRLDRAKQADKEQLERERELKPKLTDKLREERDVLNDMNAQLDAFERDLELHMKTAMSQSRVQIIKQ
jgi:hypothetical protein